MRHRTGCRLVGVPSRGQGTSRGRASALFTKDQTGCRAPRIVRDDFFMRTVVRLACLSRREAGREVLVTFRFPDAQFSPLGFVSE